MPPCMQETPTFTSGAAEAPGWLAAWVLKSAGRRYEERRAASGLLSMGDRLLRDVGISRADAEEMIRG